MGSLRFGHFIRPNVSVGLQMYEVRRPSGESGRVPV